MQEQTIDPLSLLEDSNVQARIKEEIGKMDARNEAIQARVNQMRIVHEDIVVVQKVDVISIKTFLHFGDPLRNQNIRTSWYGIVRKVSDVPSGDDVKEFKKGMLKIGDFISFNPDASYSLNVIVPEDMPEIWIVGIESVLKIDDGFDPVMAQKKTIESKVIMENMRQEQIRRGMKDAEDRLKSGQDNVKNLVRR